MPVRKFRDITEVSLPPLAPLDGENLRVAFQLSELCRRLHPWTAPRGVFRNVSIEQAQTRRATWEGGLVWGKC